MDDLIGLIFFIVVAAINLLAQSNKKKKQKRELAEQTGEIPEKQPTPFETFFEDLAEKLEPKPTPMPEWPDSIERPDYVQEMEEFEDPEEEFIPAVSVAEPPPMPEPFIPEIPIQTTSEPIVKYKTPAMVSSSVFSGTNLMRFDSIPLMPNTAGGHIHFDLQDRNNLRKAIIADLVFSQPRACDRSFDNTIAK